MLAFFAIPALWLEVSREELITAPLNRKIKTVLWNTAEGGGGFLLPKSGKEYNGNVFETKYQYCLGAQQFKKTKLYTVFFYKI